MEPDFRPATNRKPLGQGCPPRPIQPLFALYGLRQADAHTSSSTEAKTQASNLHTFGINPEKFKGGWGKALDLVYDSTAQSLRDAAKLLRSGTSRG